MKFEPDMKKKEKPINKVKDPNAVVRQGIGQPLSRSKAQTKCTWNKEINECVDETSSWERSDLVDMPSVRWPLGENLEGRAPGGQHCSHELSQVLAPTSKPTDSPYSRGEGGKVVDSTCPSFQSRSASNIDGSREIFRSKKGNRGSAWIETNAKVEDTNSTTFHREAGGFRVGGAGRECGRDHDSRRVGSHQPRRDCPVELRSIDDGVGGRLSPLHASQQEMEQILDP